MTQFWPILNFVCESENRKCKWLGIIKQFTALPGTNFWLPIKAMTRTNGTVVGHVLDRMVPCTGDKGACRSLACWFELEKWVHPGLMLAHGGSAVRRPLQSGSILTIKWPPPSFAFVVVFWYRQNFDNATDQEHNFGERQFTGLMLLVNCKQMDWICVKKQIAGIELEMNGCCCMSIKGKSSFQSLIQGINLKELETTTSCSRKLKHQSCNM